MGLFGDEDVEKKGKVWKPQRDECKRLASANVFPVS